MRNQFASILLLAMVFVVTALWAQDPSQQPNPNKQDAPPAAGGPGDDVSPYAIPKKKEDAAPPPPAPTTPKKVEGMPDYSIKVDVASVNVDVLVTTKDGQFIPNLQKNNFRVYEDGVLQPVTTFSQAQAPITAVMLIEFASTNYNYMTEALKASYTFAGGLKKEDWIAVESYDMQPHILTDFTQNKQEVYGALNQLRIPGFSERNLFDALYDTIDRIDRLEGRKYIILVSTGQDTFSKLNLDQILKKLKGTKDITIYAVSIGRALREYVDAHGGAGPIRQMDWLQADNQMNTFARLTGGRAYFPRFDGELPEIFHDVSTDIRNQYNLAYKPTNAKLDGSYRKLKVELVAPDGGPLKVRDQHGKDVKVIVYSREGYTAKHQVD